MELKVVEKTLGTLAINYEELKTELQKNWKNIRAWLCRKKKSTRPRPPGPPSTRCPK
jgi:hypothetical protein